MRWGAMVLATLLLPAMAAAKDPYGPLADVELDCIARAVYFEAGGEPLSGQIGVAQVIVNRMKDRRFADTPCGVIADGFYFPRDVAIDNAARWQTALRIAQDVAEGRNLQPQLLRALYFHGLAERPGWARVKRKLAVIGGHIFYGD